MTYEYSQMTHIIGKSKKIRTQDVWSFLDLSFIFVLFRKF